ncbi:MAG: hypothetical protein ACREEM_37880, partial [Blastocatellia bacterium]
MFDFHYSLIRCRSIIRRRHRRLGERLCINDALRIFGQPEWSGLQADQDAADPNPALYYSFSKGGEFPGELAVIVDKESKNCHFPKIEMGAALKKLRRVNNGNGHTSTLVP